MAADLTVVELINVNAAFAYTVEPGDGVAAIFTDARTTRGAMNGKLINTDENEAVEAEQK